MGEFCFMIYVIINTDRLLNRELWYVGWNGFLGFNFNKFDSKCKSFLSGSIQLVITTVLCLFWIYKEVINHINKLHLKILRVVCQNICLCTLWSETVLMQRVLEVLRQLVISARGLCYWEKSMLKSMLFDKDFLTWLLIGWQPSCQPIRTHVRNPC